MENRRNNTPKKDNDEVNQTQLETRKKADAQVENHETIREYEEFIKLKAAYLECAKQLKEEIENQKANGSSLSTVQLNQLSTDIDNNCDALEKASLVYFNKITQYKNHLSNKYYQTELKKLETAEETFKRTAKRTSSILSQPKAVVKNSIMKSQFLSEAKDARKTACSNFRDAFENLKSTVRNANTSLGNPINIMKKIQEKQMGKAFGVMTTFKRDVQNAKDLKSLKEAAKGVDVNFSLPERKRRNTI